MSASAESSSTPSEGESRTFESGHGSTPPDLRFIHFNDVYHIDASSAEPVGGVARFKAVINQYKSKWQPELLTLFSGDAFNPSTESSITKGSHMVKILNSLPTDVASLGNHDLDFGVAQFENLKQQCTFPWLIANVIDPALGENVPIGNTQRTCILNSNGIKIGIIGLAEREWLDTINTLPPNIIYKSATQTCIDLVPGLRKEGCELIIALTHQREPNDKKLAEKCPKGLIDIILGGHDHFYAHSLINGTHVLRSGTDFKQLSYIEVRRKRADGETGWDFDITRRDIVSSIVEDPDTVELVDRMTRSLRSRLEKPIGYTRVPLDARFSTNRVQETNVGNWICDLMRHHYHSDCALIAAGTIRGDQIYPTGVLKLKDIMDCFPFEDPCVVLRVTGKAIVEALENSVSKYPALEGRFPQVSNINIEFDPDRPEGARLTHVDIGGEAVDPQRKYTLATRAYMAKGRDGYDSLRCVSEGGEAEEVVSDENGILISAMLRLYFLSLKVLGVWKHWDNGLARHHDAVHDRLHEVHPVAEPQGVMAAVVANASKVGSKAGSAQPLHDDRGTTADLHEESDDEHIELKRVPTHLSKQERELDIMRKVMRKWWRLAGMQGHPDLADKLGEGEFTVHWTKAIAPRVEGRIRMLSTKS